MGERRRIPEDDMTLMDNPRGYGDPVEATSMSTESESGSTAVAKLKSCPFCGRTSKIEEFFIDDDPMPWYVATCDVCPVKTYDQVTPEIAAQYWNSRATPADTEQLVRLREAAERTLTIMNQYKERHLVPAYFSNAIADLRDTLVDPSGKKSKRTVQCADCLAWIDKDANHTCRQQVQRNQRSAR